jgi:hypothetical protein
MTEVWTNIPTVVLDAQRKAADAQAWADGWRKKIAQDWADMHTQHAYDTLGPLVGVQPSDQGPYPGALPQPAEGTDPNAAFRLPETTQEGSYSGGPVNDAVVEGERDAVPFDGLGRNRQSRLSVEPDSGLNFNAQEPGVLPPRDQIERPVGSDGPKDVVAPPHQVQGDQQFAVRPDVPFGLTGQGPTEAVRQLLGVLPPALARAVAGYLSPLAGEGGGMAATGAGNIGLHRELTPQGATPPDVSASRGQPYSISGRYLGPEGAAPPASSFSGGAAPLSPSDVLAGAPAGIPAALGEAGRVIGRGLGAAAGAVGQGAEALRTPPEVRERLRRSAQEIRQPAESALDTLGGMTEQAFPDLPPGSGRSLLEHAGGSVLGMIGPAPEAAKGVGAAAAGIEHQLASLAASSGGERASAVAGLIRTGGAYAAKRTAAEIATETKVAEAIKPASPTWIDKVQAVRYGSMLSDFAARATDIGTGILHTVERPLEHLIAGYPRAAYEDVKGIVGGVPDAVAAFTHTLSTGEAKFAMRREGQTVERPFGSGPVGRALSATTDFMAAADDFIKSVNYNGALHAEAYKLAKRVGGDAETLLQNPPPDLLDRAERAAQTVAYAEDPGAIPRWLSEGRNLPGEAGLAVSFVIPFMRVGANIARRGLERTARGVAVPGVAEAAVKLARGDPEAARYALAKTAIAGGLGALFASEAALGRLTGDGPESPSEKAMLRAQGWRPNSWNVLGSGRYVDVNQLGDVGVQAIMIAHTVESAKQAGAKGEDVFTPETVGRIVGGIASGIGDVWYLRTLQQLFTRKPEEFLANAATQALPVGGALSAVARTLDPYERATERGNIVEAVQARVPSTLLTPGRQDLPEQQDVLGRTVENVRAGLGALNPFRGGQAKESTVLRAMLDAGVNIGPPPEKVSIGKMKDIPLTAAEQREFRRIEGDEISRVIGERIASDAFKTDTPQGRATRLRKDVEKAREKAKRAVLDAMSDEDLKNRAGRAAERKTGL